MKMEIATQWLAKMEDSAAGEEEVISLGLNLTEIRRWWQKKKLQAKLTDQEKQSRRENLRIYGGVEDNPTSLVSFVEKVWKYSLEKTCR